MTHKYMINNSCYALMSEMKGVRVMFDLLVTNAGRQPEEGFLHFACIRT